MRDCWPHIPRGFVVLGNPISCTARPVNRIRSTDPISRVSWTLRNGVAKCCTFVTWPLTVVTASTCVLYAMCGTVQTRRLTTITATSARAYFRNGVLGFISRQEAPPFGRRFATNRHGRTRNFERKNTLIVYSVGNVRCEIWLEAYIHATDSDSVIVMVERLIYVWNDISPTTLQRRVFKTFWKYLRVYRQRTNSCTNFQTQRRKLW